MTKTPGYNTRLRIAFTADRNGRPVAYYWSGHGYPGMRGAGRWIRMSLAEARDHVAQGYADQVSYLTGSGTGNDPPAVRRIRGLKVKKESKRAKRYPKGQIWIAWSPVAQMWFLLQGTTASNSHVYDRFRTRKEADAVASKMTGVAPESSSSQRDSRRSQKTRALAAFERAMVQHHRGGSLYAKHGGQRVHDTMDAAVRAGATRREIDAVMDRAAKKTEKQREIQYRKQLAKRKAGRRDPTTAHTAKGLARHIAREYQRVDMSPAQLVRDYGFSLPVARRIASLVPYAYGPGGQGEAWLEKRIAVELRWYPVSR